MDSPAPPAAGAGSKRDAFTLLMSGAKQQAQPAQKQGKRRGTPTSQSGPAAKRRAPPFAAAATPPAGAPAAPQAAAAAAAVASPPAVSKEEAVAAFKRAFSSRHGGASAPQAFDYLLVYDMEATCNKSRSLQPVEIIELSAVMVETRSASITASWQSFVRPTEHAVLDAFCTELTGIQQHQVDAAPLLGEVLTRHHAWLEQQGVLADGVAAVPVTWTQWDLQIALCTECRWRRIQRPQFLCRWVDLKRAFKAVYKTSGNLKSCVERAGLTWQGRAHSGLDDATNTARLALHLMCQHGVRFQVTASSENAPVTASEQQSQQQAHASGQAQQHHHHQQQQPPSQASSQRSTAAAAAAGSPQQPEAAAAVYDAAGRWLGRCHCGVEAKKRVTKRPGRNHGREFFSCGRWRIVAAESSGCGFFLWCEEVPPGSKLPAPPPARSGR